MTNDNYWDCDCDQNYIHPITEKVCEICGALEEESPASLQDEIDRQGITGK